ncbi:hypothetical protein Plhal304r1_c012g0046621 [Plasmopara halstedii]
MQTNLLCLVYAPQSAAVQWSFLEPWNECIPADINTHVKYVASIHTSFIRVKHILQLKPSNGCLKR